MATEARSERRLESYLDAVAAGTPAPGGGSVAAVAGALGAALGEMVINLTSAEPLTGVGERLRTLRAALLAAAAADEAAYGAYRAAASLPRGAREAKAARAAAMQAALVTATDIPLAVARAATETAELMERVARDGNPHLRSDAALGALLAETALRGALLNVRGNAAMLHNRERADTYLTNAGQLEERGRTAAERAYRAATEADRAQIR